VISIAYDFDGTLVDIKARQMGLLSYICKSFQLEIDQDQFWEKKRQGANNLAVLRESGIDANLISMIDGIWRNEIESQFWLILDQKINHRFDELQSLRSMDCRTFLISARKQPQNLYQQIAMMNLESNFDEIICVDPSNKVREKANFLRSLEIDLFVGDTETDFESSQMANVEFNGVSTGQRTFKFLKQAGVQNIDFEIVDLVKLRE
jgi:phosphoglycolate phosphatase-like HAD superfamily hydrolase